MKQCCDTKSAAILSLTHSLTQETERHFTCDPTFAATVYSPKFLVSQMYSLQASSINLRSSAKPRSSASNRYASSGLAQPSRYTFSVLQPRDNVATLGPKCIRASSIGGIMGPGNATTLQLPPLSIAAVKLKRNDQGSGVHLGTAGLALKNSTYTYI